MDIYLPMLDRSTTAATELAYMLHACLSCWDTSAPRRIMSQWSPTHLPHRPTPSPSLPRGGSPPEDNKGGWVINRLLLLAGQDNLKVRLPTLSPRHHLILISQAQEAALLALSALTADNPVLCGVLTTTRPDDRGEEHWSRAMLKPTKRSTSIGLAPLALIFDLTLSLNSSVRFAALRW